MQTVGQCDDQSARRQLRAAKSSDQPHTAHLHACRLDILVAADGYDATAGIPTDGATAHSCLGQPHPAVRGLLHVTITPVASHVLHAGTGGEAAARGALEVAALCDNLRQRGGERGIRVAVVEPAGLTPRSDGSGPTSLSTGEVADAILDVPTRPPRVSIAETLLRPTG